MRFRGIELRERFLFEKGGIGVRTRVGDELGCHLDLRIETAPSTMTNRLLRPASISSNGVKIATLELKKKP